MIEARGESGRAMRPQNLPGDPSVRARVCPCGVGFAKYAPAFASRSPVKNEPCSQTNARSDVATKAAALILALDRPEPVPVPGTTR